MQWTRLFAIASVLTLNGEIRASDRISFEKQIRPILKQHCWHCHGEEPKLEGGFDARLAKSILRGGDSGQAIRPGEHANSLLFQRISANEMPPSEKKVPKEQLDLIAAWIDAGAKFDESEPDALAIGDVILDSDRQHWAFQAIAKVPIPITDSYDQVATPVDAFLIEQLAKKGLEFTTEADRPTLVRRLYLDLLGLPPDPDVVQNVSADSDIHWYEKLVEKLLSDPSYGERWGRHWLDVVGYADSDGYTEKDAERKWAWRYRDYVIKSLNADKPWNRMILEQLAGDELIEHSLDQLDENDAEKLIATGFLRMAPDGTADGSVDLSVASNEVLSETIKVVSSSLLGLTVGCAQCHSHRYDPISHTDYYRFRAIFEPAYNWKAWKKPDQRLISLWSPTTREQAVAAEKEIKQLQENRNAELDQLVRDTFDRELAKLPIELQATARLVRETPAADRTTEQKDLIKQYPFLSVDRGSVYLYLPDRLKNFNKKWDDATEAARKKKPAEDFVHCLTEPTIGQSTPPTTYVFRRGDHNAPANSVEAGELSVLMPRINPVQQDATGTSTTKRRLSYAKHLTDGNHPLVARVLVNRFWMHHFGRGLVATSTDFGLLGQSPSHPELLDWLASEFMHHGWSLKHLHRLILNSKVYRQQTTRMQVQNETDPENILLGRMSMRRLDAETLRDAMLSVSGKLSKRAFGPPIGVTPDEVGQIIVGKDNRDSAGRPVGKRQELGEDEFRRTIYVQVRRSMPLGVLEPFDNPTMNPNCAQRTNSTVAPQSLMMMNNPFVADCAEAFATRLENEGASDDRIRVIRAWWIALGKMPNDTEMQQGMSFLECAKPEIESGTEAEREFKAKQFVESRHLRLVQFCHALLCSNPFLYVE